MKRIIYDYERPHIVGRKHFTVRAVKGMPLIAAAIIIGLIAALTAAYFLFFRTGQATSRFDYYYLITGEYENSALAAAKADEVKRAGGAGYLYSDGKLKVCLFVYPLKSDAEAVAARLTEQGKSCAVVKVEAVPVKIKNNSKEVVSAFKKAARYPDELIKKFYDYALKADKSEVAESLILYEAVNAADTLLSEAGEMEKLLKQTAAGEAFELLVKFYREAEQVLRGLKAGASFKTDLKYSLCQIVDLYTKFTSKSVNLKQ